ncbi:MAG: hypothetical protein K2J47_10705 [Ruminococcus sp.]|nr:hypothetical protein [Ruminococcus sp.]
MKKILLIICVMTMLTGCADNNFYEGNSIVETASNQAKEVNFKALGKEVQIIGNDGIIQILECNYIADTEKIITEDFDFDGFDDLFISMERGAMFAPGTYFRFNPETELYEKWDMLNEIGCEMIADTESKTLKLRNNSSSYWLEYFVYKWENGNIVLCEHDISETGEKMLIYSVDSHGNETFTEEIAIMENMSETTETTIETVTTPLTEAATESPSNIYEKQTYREVLENIYYNRKFPKYNHPFDDNNYDITENEFLIHDIDNDGSDELIVLFKSYYGAGQFGSIYDHNSEGNIVLQFHSFWNFTFYPNGNVEVGLSHNQGQFGRFWPYVMYQYDAETEKYREVGYIEALDKEVVDIIRKQQEEAGQEPTWEYPYDVDTSGTGFVYYISPSVYDIDDVEPVDFTEYEKWHNYSNPQK